MELSHAICTRIIQNRCLFSVMKHIYGLMCLCEDLLRFFVIIFLQPISLNHLLAIIFIKYLIFLLTHFCIIISRKNQQFPSNFRTFHATFSVFYKIRKKYAKWKIPSRLNIINNRSWLDTISNINLESAKFNFCDLPCDLLAILQLKLTVRFNFLTSKQIRSLITQ